MKIAVFFYKLSSFISCMPFLDQVDYIYLPSDSLKDEKKFDHLDPSKIFISFPIISKGKAFDLFIKRLEGKKYNFLLQNIGDINISSEYANLIHADYSFNVQNTGTMELLEKEGFDAACLSTELSPKDQEILAYANKGNIKSQIIVYGRQILMRSEHCFVAGKEGYHCNKCLKDDYYLENESGKIFPLLTNHIDCQSALLNYKPIEIEDKDILRKIKSNKSSIIRLNIFEEDSAQVLKLIEFYRRI